MGAAEVIKGVRAGGSLLTASGVAGLMALLKASPGLTEVRMYVLAGRITCTVILIIIAEYRLSVCPTPPPTLLSSPDPPQLDVSESSAFDPEAACMLGELLLPRHKLSLNKINLRRCPIKDQGERMYEGGRRRRQRQPGGSCLL